MGPFLYSCAGLDIRERLNEGGGGKSRRPHLHSHVIVSLGWGGGLSFGGVFG